MRFTCPSDDILSKYNFFSSNEMLWKWSLQNDSYFFFKSQCADVELIVLPVT